MFPATPWEERQMSMLEESCYQSRVCTCVSSCVCRCSCVHIQGGKLSSCSQSALAFVRQGPSQVWGLPNRLGWTANESQGLLPVSQVHDTIPVFVWPVFLGWNSSLWAFKGIALWIEPVIALKDLAL